VTGEAVDTIADFETMFDSRGTSLELVILEMPTSSSSNSFTDPEDHTIYCHFSRYGKYTHIAGLSYRLKIGIQEER
jgi:hypothetical protein